MIKIKISITIAIALSTPTAISVLAYYPQEDKLTFPTMITAVQISLTRIVPPMQPHADSRKTAIPSNDTTAVPAWTPPPNDPYPEPYLEYIQNPYL